VNGEVWRECACANHRHNYLVKRISRCLVMEFCPCMLLPQVLASFFLPLEETTSLRPRSSKSVSAARDSLQQRHRRRRRGLLAILSIILSARTRRVGTVSQVGHRYDNEPGLQVSQGTRLYDIRPGPHLQRLFPSDIPQRHSFGRRNRHHLLPFVYCDQPKLRFFHTGVSLTGLTRLKAVSPSMLVPPVKR